MTSFNLNIDHALLLKGFDGFTDFSRGGKEWLDVRRALNDLPPLLKPQVSYITDPVLFPHASSGQVFLVTRQGNSPSVVSENSLVRLLTRFRTELGPLAVALKKNGLCADVLPCPRIRLIEGRDYGWLAGILKTSDRIGLVEVATVPESDTLLELLRQKA